MTTIQLVSVAIAAIKCRRREGYVSPPKDAPAVTVLRPVCGVDNCADETLGSTFRLDYPHYEIIFCVARADDPAVAIVNRLIAATPLVGAQLLIGDDRVSANPKLNNVIKGWAAARHDWIVIADSNLLMPRDYLQRLLACWRSDTGLVCSTPIAMRPANFWAELECAFLNTLQARWQYVGASLGLGFAQGKTMLFRRDIVERGGGLEALGAEPAEDAAATKLVRRQGLNVHLVDNPFEQPLGRRTGAEVWARQVRWARLRRVTFPLFFLAELLTGAALPILAGCYAAVRLGLSPGPILALLLVLWYGAEAMLARTAGWHFSPRLPLALLLRDLALPVLWIAAWLSNDFVWRGNAMNLHATVPEETSETARP
ncbi:MAG TPA: ceramide glucosyltransferase [Stellaceae bacterium]|nr:ceramide glucosyltransferase [Stellaceae bacterium]